ncbi:putative bacteriophage protein [Shigella sonnei]|nr:putative bacteriophage protein [Shigella sonnei]
MAFVDKDGVEVESSTHWMPLPEPPQVFEGNKTETAIAVTCCYHGK